MRIPSTFYRWLPGGCVVTVLLVLVVIGWRESFVPARHILWQQVSGYAALAALLISLACTPAARWLPQLAVVQARRRWGLTAAALAGLHSALACGTILRDRYALIWEELWLQAGAAALLALVALAVTSYPTLVRLGRVTCWKPLHRLSYAALVLALLHVLFSPYASRRTALWLAAIGVVLLACRWLPRRKPGTRRKHPLPSREAATEATRGAASSLISPVSNSKAN